MVFDRERYACEFNTLPKYIFVDSQGRVDNFEYIMTQIDPTDILRFYNETNVNAIEKMDLTLVEIALPFTLFNQKLHKVIQELRGDMFFVANALNLSEEVSSAVASIWSDISDQREYEAILKSADFERTLFKEEYEKRLAQKQLFEAAVPFEVGSSTLSSVNNVYAFEKATSLLGVFNDIELDSSLYLATTSLYYKVLNKTPYALEYPDTDDKMYIFLKGTRIVVESRNDPSRPEYNLTVPEVPKGFDINDIKRILKTPALNLTGRRLNMSINFYTPKLLTFELNKTIWSDLIMNNQVISDKFVVDEHLKTSKYSDLSLIHI
jgi:hypothetical protein